MLANPAGRFQMGDPVSGSRLLGVRSAARHLGVSVKTFRDRIMPHVPALVVSEPTARRQRRMFTEDAIDETIRELARPAVRPAP